MAASVEKLSLQAGTVSCSVCLEHVSDVGERSIAKLKCGHHFHLDCIGSAFNAKGSMQCPNCRHVEEGRWLYANGCRSHEDFNFDDLPSSYEDDYEVYAGIADMLHPHHELQFGHFQWCPYQSSYPQFSVTLEEVDPPAGGYPDVIVNVLYGDHGASVNPQHVCPYLAAQSVRHSRRLDDQVVVVHNQIDIPNGGPLGGNPRGPQSFAVPERTGWSSQSAAHIPASTGVGMMNDVGLSSLPNDRFRWSVPASRSDASQLGYNGQSRVSENSGSAWHTPVPCPQHGYGGSSNSFPQNVSPRYGHDNSRRTRPRGFATPSSSAARPLPTEPVRPFRAAAWPTASSMGPGQDLNTAPFNSGGWHGNNQSYQWRRDNRAWGGYDLDSQWRPWFQTSGNMPGTLDSASGSYHPELVYGDASYQAGQRVAPEGHYGHSGFPSFSQAFPSDGQPEVASAHLRPFMQPPR